MRTDVVIALIFGLFLLTTRDAYAYLDPGTGSLIFQGIIAGLGAGVLVIRMYWGKLKRLVRGGPPRGQGRGEGAVE